ncbi:MAG TPA: hypothetical protein ENJ35_09245 [Gammaproteobacteria bacterium]|nr:hypothetical protein [Gammaproteobacteria bacterium]
MSNSFTGSSDKIYVVTFIVIVLVSVVAFEFLARQYIVALPRSEAHRAKQIYSSDTGRVAIGDSHVYRGFILSNGITNLGKRGTSIQVMDSVLRLYYRLHKPGQLVIEASPQLLNEKNKSNRVVTNGYKSRFFPPLLYIFEPVISSDLARIFDGFRFRENIAKLTAEKKMQEKDRYNSIRWDSVPVRRRLKRAFRKTEQQTPVWTKKENPVLQEYRQLLDYLLEKGVQVCMLRTPVSKEYLSVTDNNPDYMLAETEFRALATGVGVKYVDFQDIGISWVPEMFINQDHITPEASRIFSKKVWDACFLEAQGENNG